MKTYNETSPFYFSRTDVSDEDKLRALKNNIAEALEDSKAGRVYTYDEAEKMLAEMSKHSNTLFLKNAG